MPFPYRTWVIYILSFFSQLGHMSRSRYISDQRSVGRKLRDAVLDVEATPEELAADAKRLARKVQRDLTTEIRACKKELADIQRRMRAYKGNPEGLRSLARQSVQEQRAIEKLTKEHQDVGHQHREVVRFKALGAKADLVRIRGLLSQTVAREMDPERTMRQQEAMIRNQMRIETSQEVINHASGMVYGGDEDRVEELTEELFQQACDMAGLQSSESFTQATTVPNTSLVAQEDPTEVYLANRIAQLNRHS